MNRTCKRLGVNVGQPFMLGPQSTFVAVDAKGIIRTLDGKRISKDLAASVLKNPWLVTK